MTAVLFDLDGTLLNTLDDLADGVNMTLSHFGYPCRTVDEVRQFVGNGAARLIRLSLPENAGGQEVTEALAYFKDYYAAHSQEKTRPYGGIPEALARVWEAFPVAIVSNKPDNAVKLLCQQYFPGIPALGERDTCPRKPAPDMVYQALALLGAQTCIYVGDSEVDVQTAKNAGVPCLSVLWGFRDRESLLAAGAAHFCQTPAALLRSLKELV